MNDKTDTNPGLDNLFIKFSNEPYVPRAKWNTSTEFIPDPILTSSQYKNDVVPVDTTSQDHSRS